MLRGMDGDIFGAVTRLGRAAAEALLRVLDGGPRDPFLPARCLDVLIGAANGVPSLPGVLRELNALRDNPLFARSLGESALERISDEVRAAKGTVLDLMLRSEAERCVLRGNYDPHHLVRGFCTEVLDRAIVSGRGGLLEQVGPARCREARSLLADVASEAAAILVARPDAQHLGLARRYAHIEADTNLLGGVE